MFHIHGEYDVFLRSGQDAWQGPYLLLGAIDTYTNTHQKIVYAKFFVPASKCQEPLAAHDDGADVSEAAALNGAKAGM